MVLLIASLAIGLYPSISNYVKSKCAEGTIDNYRNEVDALDTATKKKMFNDAKLYNDQLKDQETGYYDVLNFN